MSVKLNNVTYAVGQKLVLVCDSKGIRTEHTRIPKGIHNNTLREVQAKWAVIERAEDEAYAAGKQSTVPKPSVELKAEVISDKFGEGVTVKLLNEADYLKSFKRETTAKAVGKPNVRSKPRQTEQPQAQ